MTPVDASNNPDKGNYYIKSTKATPKGKPGLAQLKSDEYIRKADKRNLFSKGYTCNWTRELFKVKEVLKTQQPRYRIEEINDEIIECKNYAQELLKSELILNQIIRFCNL